MQEESVDRGLAAKMNQVRADVARVVLGQDRVIDEVMIALVAGGHVLIEGVPGLGKTLLVKAISRALAADFGRIQFTPDLMPSDVTGHAIFDPKEQTFRIRRGPVFTNLLLADEINRAPAKTQSALLEAMQERQVTVEGKAIAIAPPFMTVATQNPVEHEGTYPLPEAQLDRFLFKVLIDYPAADAEQEIVKSVVVGRIGADLNVDSVPASVDSQTIIRAQQAAAELRIDDRVVQYALDVCRATRSRGGVAVGASPRGSIALVRAARARAFLAERDFVVPDDVREVALPTLRHRLILAPELELEGQRPDQVLETVLDAVEAPRE